jgi:photosystem II stability/assembly factor-like uncharacterized protein
MLSGLVWRNIGPFRGGRVSAVSGAVGQPGVFYIGLPAGGVWKTTGGGATWVPLMDGVKEASSVGAVEVAPSNPNVVYVGMGDMVTGGGINEGNGVYKSIDAGKTWQHLGLASTKQIPSILVDPHDPDLVMVAAQGNLHARSEDRGLFRSTDGGKNWTKTLYVDDQTGIQKITWAYDHPNVMLATTDRHYSAPGTARGPGGGAGAAAGGSGTRLFKSTDEGLTWKEITGGGLPRLTGRTCVAIAMNTNAQRMLLVQISGLYRSDDGGATWRQMDAADRRVSNGQGGYNCGVYVDSKDPDTVYVVNTCLYRSTDGGNTFTGFKGAPGGDDPQQLWIDPTDHLRILLGSDQGATVSLDGGTTWGSWYNQPTAQVYHISVDNSYPYWVYATQQDSGAIATRSRGDLGEITPLDWLPTPGYEFGSIVPDPLNPKVLYCGGPAGGIVKITYPSGQWIDVSPNMDRSLGLRKVGNQPLAWSGTNPHELLAGFQFLMATTDGGRTWKKLSPDLGQPKEAPAPPKSKAPAAAAPARTGGSIATDEDQDDEAGNEEDDQDEDQFGGSQGGAIESISSSALNPGVIWVGTNNGLIKLTRNGGRTWEDVTIPGLPNPARADVSAIDASHSDPATAYAAIDYHNVADYAPYLYRTHDYGRTWTKIVTGLPTDIPSGCFARVIRSDTERPGLLFAGTESSVYVSFDDGDNWQSLGLNLPNTSYRDMVVKGKDLVVGTYGRGFWILDDISPLRQLSQSVASEPAHLFKPGDAIRVRRNVNGDTPFPPEVPHAQNPPDGAILYYYLGSQPSSEVTIDITDRAGNLVRHMSSAPVAKAGDPPPPVPDFWVETPKPLTTSVGLNRVNWNLRFDSPPAFDHAYEINANPGATPASPEGPLVLPGVYTVSLKVDGKSYSQEVTVRNDPRSPASSADLRAQVELQTKLFRCARQAWDLYHQVADMRATISKSVGSDAPSELTKAASDLDMKMANVEGSTGGRRGFGGFRGGPAGAPTFSGANGAIARQLNNLDAGDMVPSMPMRKACEAACGELAKAIATWNALNEKDIAAFNALLAKHNMKTVEPAAKAALTQ